MIVQQKVRLKKTAWTCSFRCKSLSGKDVATIVSLKQIFHNDIIPELRQSLEECDKCPHVHSFKQEWHIPFRCRANTVEQNDDSLAVKEPAVKPFKPAEWKGHPLVCHLPESPCESKLRVLRAAVTHYPKLANFQKNVYSAHKAHFTIQKIDRAINNKNYKSLLEICNTSFSEVI